MDPAKLKLAAQSVDPTPFEVPGATGGQFRIQILNQDPARGVVTSIVHLPAGGRIPAHFHHAGPEMHYVLEGDLIEAGEELKAGAFLTHPPGAVHGPHESRGGAKVLTVQHGSAPNGSFDFILAEDSGEGRTQEPPPGGTAAAALPPDPTAPDLGGRDAEATTG